MVAEEREEPKYSNSRLQSSKHFKLGTVFCYANLIKICINNIIITASTHLLLV